MLYIGQRESDSNCLDLKIVYFLVQENIKSTEEDAKVRDFGLLSFEDVKLETEEGDRKAEDE